MYREMRFDKALFVTHAVVRYLLPVSFSMMRTNEKLGIQIYVISDKFPFGYLINEMAFLDFIPAGVVFNFPIYWFDVHGV